VVVFEAASLKDVFAKLAQRSRRTTRREGRRERRRQQELRTQIEHGAGRRDGSATASKGRAAVAGVVVAPTVFHLQRAVVVVRAALARRSDAGRSAARGSGS
jgi:hypothetical protein